ncbi:MAG: trigger factor [Deltaproteobacteria bacterium]|nr:trigger factor [Deltaproteobacteria bacterium]
MKVSVQDIDGVKKKIMVSIPVEEVDNGFNSAYRELSKTARLKGFRPGKAPKSVLERYFGKQMAENVSGTIVKETLAQALEETGLDIVSEPNVDIAPIIPKQEFTYSMTVEVKPEIQITEYRDLELSKEASPVTDEALDKRIEQIRESHAQLKPISETRALQTGDFATVDFQGYDQGKPMESLKTDGADFEIGGTRSLPEFSNNLSGMSKGETREFDVTYPPDINQKEIAGKTIHFNVTLQEIKEKVLPKLDDDFVKDLGGDLENLEQFKASVREEMELIEKERSDTGLREAAINLLIQNSTLKMPEAMVSSEMARLIQNFTENLNRQGVKLPDSAVHHEQLAKEFQPRAERNVQASLILEKIATLESIEVTEEDLTAYYGKLADQVKQDVSVIRDLYRKDGDEDSLRNQLLTEKALNFVIEHARITEHKLD